MSSCLTNIAAMLEHDPEDDPQILARWDEIFARHHPDSITVNGAPILYKLIGDKKQTRVVELASRYFADPNQYVFDDDEKSDRNQPLLMKAIDERDIRRCRILLKLGADPTLRNGCDDTSLHIAVTSPNILQLMLGATPQHLLDQKSLYGDTALMRAIQSGMPESVRLLLDAGADLFLRTPITDRSTRQPFRYSGNRCSGGLLTDRQNVAVRYCTVMSRIARDKHGVLNESSVIIDQMVRDHIDKYVAVVTPLIIEGTSFYSVLIKEIFGYIIG